MTWRDLWSVSEHLVCEPQIYMFFIYFVVVEMSYTSVSFIPSHASFCQQWNWNWYWKYIVYPLLPTKLKVMCITFWAQLEPNSCFVFAADPAGLSASESSGETWTFELWVNGEIQTDPDYCNLILWFPVLVVVQYVPLFPLGFYCHLVDDYQNCRRYNWMNE